MNFELNDQRHLEAAEGWLELGNHLEANEELENITPQMRVHPDVLEIRWHIYAKEKKWDACVDIAATIIKLAPENYHGWIHRSFALHELKRTEEAFENLLPVADKFPDSWTIPYNLACYLAQLHRIDEAQVWFKKAMTIDEKTVQQSLLGGVWTRAANKPYARVCANISANCFSSRSGINVSRNEASQVCSQPFSCSCSKVLTIKSQTILVIPAMRSARSFAVETVNDF